MHCFVHDSSADCLIAAGQLNDGQSNVQGGSMTWSWSQSVQTEESWYL